MSFSARVPENKHALWFIRVSFEAACKEAVSCHFSAREEINTPPHLRRTIKKLEGDRQQRTKKKRKAAWLHMGEIKTGSGCGGRKKRDTKRTIKTSNPAATHSTESTSHFKRVSCGTGVLRDSLSLSLGQVLCPRSLMLSDATSRKNKIWERGHKLSGCNLFGVFFCAWTAQAPISR